MIYQERGDYASALQQYEQSLKIKEELGDRAGVAQSLHQVGMICQIQNKHAEAFENYMAALAIFAQIGSPNGKIALNSLIKLRDAWGAENFDKAWKEKTGEDFNLIE